MNILNWIFFITASIGFIISILGSLINIEDDEDKVIIFNFCNFITIGLVFYTSVCIFNNTVTLIILWSILGIAILQLIYTLYKFLWDSINVEIFYKIISIILLFLLIIIVFLSFKLNISSKIIDVNVGNAYKPVIPIVEIVLVFWIPLIIILLIFWKIKSNASQNNVKESVNIRNSDVNELIHRLYYSFREYLDMDYSNPEKLHRMFDEAYMLSRKYDIHPEQREIILKNIDRLISTRRIPKSIYSLSEFRSMLLYGFSDSYESNNYSYENAYLLENITERIQTIMKKELSRNNKNYDYNSIKSISDGINELKALLVKQVEIDIDFKQNKISATNSISYQQQFIKELFHCLMTPISQVDASLSTMKAKIPQIDEVLERSMKSIKAGIELTKSVLFAYRQVAFYTYNNTNDDTLTIKDGINSAELLYQNYNKKNIIFEDKDIPESISGLSSYFVLATILPLLENAICATESELQITIEYICTEQNHIFKITNPVKNSVNISNLYKEGFSSKNEKGKPHKGTGLSIVRNLISNIENSKLEFEFDNNILVAILKIHNYGV